MITVINDEFKTFVQKRVTVAELAAESSKKCRELMERETLASCELQPLLRQIGANKLYGEATEAARDLWNEYSQAAYMQGFRDAMRILAGS